MIRWPDGRTETAYSFWLKLGQNFGWDKAPGTRFEIKQVAGNQIEISSNGAGHGVGLCQWGACGLAKQGAGYKKILSYYFPGSKIEMR
jgi:stage II sporulation protein D